MFNDLIINKRANRNIWETPNKMVYRIKQWESEYCVDSMIQWAAFNVKFPNFRFHIIVVVEIQMSTKKGRVWQIKYGIKSTKPFSRVFAPERDLCCFGCRCGGAGYDVLGSFINLIIEGFLNST